jgi:hypothetical protein
MTKIYQHHETLGRAPASGSPAPVPGRRDRLGNSLGNVGNFPDNGYE